MKRARPRKILFALLLAALVLCGQAGAFTLSLWTEPHTEILSFDFQGGALPAYSIRRTGAQQLTLTFHQDLDSPLPAPPTLGGGSLISAVHPTPNGYLILLKTKAFGYVSAPVPRQSQFEVHIFSDVVGSRWADLPRESLSLTPIKPVLPPPTAKPGKTATAPARKLVAVAAPAPEKQEATPQAANSAAPHIANSAAPQIANSAAPQAANSAAPHIANSAAPHIANSAAPQAPTPQPKVEAAAQPAPSSSPAPEAPTLARTEALRPLPQFAAQSPLPELTTPSPQPQGAAEQTLSLREALARALKNNPRLRAAQSRVAGAEHNIDAARGMLLPHAQMGAGITKVNNPSSTVETDSDYVNQISKTYNLQVSQNIFDGLVRLSNLARTKLTSTRTNQDLRKTELDTIDAVQREYFKLIRTRSDINTYRASVSRLMNQRDAAHAFYRLEMAPRLTVLQVETALGQTQQKLSRTMSDEQVQLVKLNALLGSKEGERFDFKGDLMGYSFETQLDFAECLRKAQNNLPEVIIAKTDVEIAQEELNMSQGRALPKVDATAAYIKQNTDYKNHTTTDLDRKYYTMGLNFSWEFFSGGENYYEIETKKKLIQATQSELSNLMLTVHALVRENHLNVVEAKNQIRIATLRSKEAAEAFDQASTRFRAGIGTSIDVLDAHERVTSAEAAFNQAQAEFLTALASLHRIMGEKDLNLVMLAAGDPTPAPTAGSAAPP